MKQIGLCFCLFLSFLFAYSQGGISEYEDGQLILYNPDRKITWVDFKGVVDPRSPFDAVTNSGVKYSYRWERKKGLVFLEFEVNSFFDTGKSWVKQGQQSEALLRHEYLHFCIAEIHARIFRKSILAYPFSRAFEAEIEYLFTNNNRSRKEMQDRYDKESDHFLNNKGQKKWEKIVKKRLRNLAKYRSPSFYLSF